MFDEDDNPCDSFILDFETNPQHSVILCWANSGLFSTSDELDRDTLKGINENVDINKADDFDSYFQNSRSGDPISSKKVFIF